MCYERRRDHLHGHCTRPVHKQDTEEYEEYNWRQASPKTVEFVPLKETPARESWRLDSKG